MFEDPERLLREREAERYTTLSGRDQASYRTVYWRKADPLHLTPANERRLEHLARMIYADIRFSAPEVGLRGWDTDRGHVYVRYGPPRRVFQVRRESAKEMNPALTAAAMDLLKCQRVVHTLSDSVKDLSGCDFGWYLGAAGTSSSEGGRWIFWNYDPELPSFIFEKQLRSRWAKHKPETRSRLLAEEAIERAPVLDASPYAIRELPVQVARFRGPRPGVTHFLVMPGQLPEFGAAAPDSVETGLFVFGPDNRLVAQEQHPGLARAFYEFRTGPGAYDLSVEVLEAPRRRAGRWRATLPALEGKGAGPALSDLLLARSVQPLSEEPRTRTDFAILPNPALELRPGEALALYFEVYDLAPGADGTAAYSARLTLTDAQARPVVLRVLEGVRRWLGAEEREPVTLAWERVLKPAGDRVPEYLVVDPGTLPPGRYRLTVEVSTPAGEAPVRREREFTVMAEPRP